VGAGGAKEVTTATGAGDTAPSARLSATRTTATRHTITESALTTATTCLRRSAPAATSSRESTFGFGSTITSFAFTAGGLRDREPAAVAPSVLASGGFGVRALTFAGLGVTRGADFATDALAFFDPGATDALVRGARTDLRGRSSSSLI
jgi:hypothetical protein